MKTIIKNQKLILGCIIFFSIAACSFQIKGNEIYYLASEYPYIGLAFAGISLILSIILSNRADKKIVIALTIFILLFPFTFVAYNEIKWIFISYYPPFALVFVLLGLFNLYRLLIKKTI